MAAVDFTGRAAVVTGGTRGIGATIAQELLAAGADVAVCGRQQPETLPTASGRTARFLSADVRDPEQATAMVTEAVAELGRLDLLVNNAGGSPPADAAIASPRFTERVVALNLLAPLYVSQAAYPALATAGGSIVMVGSVSGLRPSPGTAAYGAAKAGLHHLATSLAVEWAPKVRVNVVAAGLVRTEHSELHYGDDAGVAAVAATVPAGRLAEPRDVAQACLWLASDAASYVSGTVLVVHGGGERPAFLDAADRYRPLP